MKDKAAVGAHLYLEDAPSNIERLRAAGQRVICVGNSTNRDVPDLQRSGIMVDRARILAMKQFTAVIERDADTGFFVGWVPGFPGAHSQGQSLDELRANLREVIEMLLEDGTPT